MADNDRDDKFVSQDGEMEFLPVEEINKIKLQTQVDLDDDELDLDEIDEEDLQDLADDEEE